jgi:hypothetical protein
MVLNLERMITREIHEAVDSGQIAPYIVCAVNLYATKESADKEGRSVNPKRVCRIRPGIGLFPGEKYLLDRHYLIVDIRFEQTYPCTDIAELAREMHKMRVRNYNRIEKEVLEQDDEETAYVWAPLTDTEAKELEGMLETLVQNRSVR